MADPSRRALRRSVATIACLVSAAALLTGPPAAGGEARAPFRVLQMNLCGSGIAGCYSGRAVTEAAAVIRGQVPDLVTLNEVCRADVYTLGQVLAEVHRDDAVVEAFRAAGDRRTAGEARCRNGQPYGIGVLARLPAPDHGYTTHSGIYPTQDPDDPELRAWLCLHATDAFYACTTHLAYITRSVSLAQCRHLLEEVIPAVRAGGGHAPVVLAGDLNLAVGGSPDVRSCAPSSYLRVDDGGVQQLLATPDFMVRSRTTISMNGTTDHPSLLVALTGG